MTNSQVLVLDDIFRLARAELIGAKAATLDGALSGFITGAQVTPDGVLLQFSYWFNGQLSREWVFHKEIKIEGKTE